MEQNVYSNNRGFTLLELLAGMVIMMVGLLGLLQVTNVALQHNMSSQLRNEAVLVADEQMAIEMTKPFDQISSSSSATTSTKPVPRQVYNGFKNYSVAKTGTDVTSNTKQVSIVVTWKYKGQAFNHSISSLISKSN